MVSLMITARGTNVVRELVRYVSNGRAVVESGDVAIYVDGGERIVGDLWRHEARQDIGNQMHVPGAVLNVV